MSDYRLIMDMGCHANMEAGLAIERIARLLPNETDQMMVILVAAHAMAQKLRIMREGSSELRRFIDFLDSVTDEAMIQSAIEALKAGDLSFFHESETGNQTNDPTDS